MEAFFISYSVNLKMILIENLPAYSNLIYYLIGAMI